MIIDTKYHDRIIDILHNMSLENKGFKKFFRRFYIHHEPLRNDAYNLLKEMKTLKFRPITTKYIGEK